MLSAIKMQELIDAGYDARLLALFKLVPKAYAAIQGIDGMLDKIDTLTKEGLHGKAFLQEAKKRELGPMESIEFLAQLLDDLTARLPRIVEILADPAGAPVPANLNHQWQVASSLAYEANDQTIDAIVIYWARLESDIASMAAHNTIIKEPGLKAKLEHLLAL